MDEYINREIVLQEIIKAQESLESNIDKEWTRNKPYFKGLAWANRIISETPAADVVEVVRCKDCKYLRGKDYCYLTLNYRVVEPNHFCSYGKKKTD